MKYEIKNIPFLRRVLWVDFGLGASSGLLGIVLYQLLAPFLGLSVEVILWISIITVLYSIVAFRLVRMTDINIRLLSILIFANWAWTIVSMGIIYFHFADAQFFGKIFLVLQIIIVGGLAYIEGAQLKKVVI